jgi:hypothetical protein
MSVTYIDYAPSGVETIGMSKLAFVPAIADINVPKLTEIEAGTGFECATESFGSTTSVNYKRRQKLCNKVASQRPSDRTYEIAPITLTMEDPQAAQTLIDELVIDSTQFVVHRPGKDHSVPFAVGDKVQVTKVIIASVDLVPLAVEGGQEYEVSVAFSVQARSDLLVSIAA